MPRRSARIRAREAAVSADDFPLSSVDDTESNRKWCCCGVVSRGQTAFFRILGGEKRVWCNSNSCLLLSRPHIPGTLIE